MTKQSGLFAIVLVSLCCRLTAVNAEVGKPDADVIGVKPKSKLGSDAEQMIDRLPGYDRSVVESPSGTGEALMMGGAMPRIVDIQDLPDPESVSAKLLNRYCAQCHGLPSPDQHSAESWLPVANRMMARMKWMTFYSNIRIDLPTAEEFRQITEYLSIHARPNQ